VCCLRGSFPAEEQVLISRLQALEEQNEVCCESLRGRVSSRDANPPAMRRTAQALTRRVARLEKGTKRHRGHAEHVPRNPRGNNQKNGATECSDCGVSKHEAERWYISNTTKQAAGTLCKSCMLEKKRKERQGKKVP
jgi:hypothetical protein